MPIDTSKFERLCFNYETSSKTDYRGLPGPMGMPYDPTTDNRAPPKPKKAKPISNQITSVKYVTTMMHWQSYYPFNMTHELKDILQTNPHRVQEPYEKPTATKVQMHRLEAISPAFNLLDIKDERIKDILKMSTYTSEMNANFVNHSSSELNVKAPLPRVYAGPNPIALAKWKPPYVAPEWRWKDSVEWDRRQLRGYVDPMAEFWLRPRNETPKKDT